MRTLIRKPGARSPGFTMIELLVVIAIVMILAGILVPAVRSVLTTATKTRCMANMKAWGAFINMHASKNSGDVPVLAAAGDPLYLASDCLKQFFSTNKINTRLAYSPSNDQTVAFAATALAPTDTWWIGHTARNVLQKVKEVDDADLLGAAPGVPTEIVKDEQDGSGVTINGSWNTAGNPIWNAGGVRYIAGPAVAGRSIRWSFTFPNQGPRNLSCEVWIYSNTGTAVGGGVWNTTAPYQVTDKIGPHDYLVNQDTVRGWFRLQTSPSDDTRFEFTEGQQYSVLLTDNTPAGRQMMGDAVKIIPKEATGGPPPPNENGFRIVAGTWPVSSDPAFYKGSTHTIQRTANPVGVARWCFYFASSDLVAPKLSVYAYWDMNAGRSTAVVYKTAYEGGEVVTTVDQRNTGGTWMPIAVDVPFVAGKQYYVEITSQVAGGTGDAISADAIQIATSVTQYNDAQRIGYLYLGDRANLPGIKYNTPEWSLVANTSAVDNPAGTPILVDYICKESSSLTTHKDGAGHVLMLDGHVEDRTADKVFLRWEDQTDGTGTRYYW